MTIRFGASPIAWINDDMPALGGATALKSVLSDLRDLGFAGVELGGRFPRQPEALAALLGAYRLDLAGGWYGAHLLARSAEAEIEAMQPHLALLKAMGCKTFILAEVSNAIHGDMAMPLARRPQLSDDEWPEFGRRLTAVADYLVSQGLRLAYHYHLGTVVERAQDIDAFLRHTGDTAGFTLDTGHAALGGIDAVELIRRAPERIAHVHCKDVRPSIHEDVVASSKSFLDGVLAGMFTVPGDGALDFARIMRALDEIGYSGWIILEAEQDPAVADPRIYAELGLATLRREARAAGLMEAI
ncbi:myo-inosose-2 dehydratase [Sphingobium sp.]|uniref:myo-inosose-2 dehydratase n=1 Tax=Sphingobium sp. TaxID=1912891 RepID=UPI0028BE56C1|nr:myo-inosose-2 dehydratase [Sphingobium sp.]